MIKALEDQLNAEKRQNQGQVEQYKDAMKELEFDKKEVEELKKKADKMERE